MLTMLFRISKNIFLETNRLIYKLFSSILKTSLVLLVFSSCTFHMRTRKEAKTYFNLLKNSNKDYHSKLIEENNLLKFELKESSNKLVNTYIFKFDEKGKQLSYYFNSSCYDCFSKSVNSELNEKRYRWQKQNDSTYLSKKRLNRILLIDSSIKTFEIKKYISN